MLLSDGVLFLVRNAAQTPKKGAWWNEGPRQILALDAKTGKKLWAGNHWVAQLTLTVDGTGVYFCAKDHIACLDRASGKPLWKSAPVPRGESFPSHFAPTLVVSDGVLLFAGGEAMAKKSKTWYMGGGDTMTALDAKTGKKLWSADHPPSGYASPEDLFVVDGQVWLGDTTSGRAVGLYKGLDLRTGKVTTQFPPDVKIYWFHHRCYRGKATENYIIPSRAGTEFVDFRKQTWDVNHWVRGACLYGVMPANGLLYAPQHPCACYLESKLHGFNALASKASLPKPTPRLQRGSALGEVGSGQEAARDGDWPTYRCDVARSGSTKTAVPAQVRPLWATELRPPLSSVVCADGKVFVAAIDAHAVHALDAISGKVAWSVRVGGRVDSPPTIWKGRVLFGSADGHIYCLRASDGAQVWRFRAAPVDQRLPYFEQIESVWPVHGSVLVQNGVLTAVAGRSVFTDGGLRYCRLDPATGELLSETILSDREEGTGKGHQEFVSWLNMPAALPDILSSDGRLVYMKSQPFDLNGKRLPLEAMPKGRDADAGAPPATQDPKLAHLFCPTGFLDDSWWHRTYWLYGSRFVSGWQGYYRSGKATPAGRILVFDDDRIYGYGRELKYFRWTTPIEHHLFATERKAALDKTFQWEKPIPLFARAMVLAKDTLFIAGPPDRVDETKLQRSRDPKVFDLYAAALSGTLGGTLWAVSTTTGEKLASCALRYPPVFDGLIAANGKLFMSTIDGKVLCLGATE